MNKKHRALAILEGHEEAFFEAELKAASQDVATEAPESDLLQIVEGVGVVSVKGRLTNTNSPYNSFFGLVSYDQIREAAVEALNSDVMTLLFDVDTPGGSVAGMRGLADFIEAVEVPTVFHTSATMASAGIFLGLSGDYIFSDDMAEVGSVGVVLTTYDYTEAMKKEGVSAEVFRSGKHKQAGTSVEKLSPENKKYIQGQVDTYAGKFFSYVEERRGMSRQTLIDNEIATGRTFIGEQAVAAGLVDMIMTFDEALSYSYYLGKKMLDKQAQVVDYYGSSQKIYGSSSEHGGNMSKKTMSMQALAALVAGDPVIEPADVKAEADATLVDVKAEADVAPEAVVDPAVKDLTDKLAISETAVKDLTDKLTANEVLASALTAKVEAADKLAKIVASQISTMRTALSLTAVDLSEFSADNIVREYEAVTGTFIKAFPVGGVVPKATEIKKEVAGRDEIRNYAALGF